MKRSLPIAALGVALLWATPATATDDCSQCPQVRLLRVEDQVRIAAEDDNDLYEDLRHRVRFVTAAGASGWSDWSDANAYGLRPGLNGRVEAESVDLDGHVGRAVIHVTTPNSDDEASRGPGTVAEDSTTEARWDEEAGQSDGSTSSELEEEIEESGAADWLEAQSYDHDVCPVSGADSDSACSTTPSSAPNNGVLAALLALVALLLGRGVRRDA